MYGVKIGFISGPNSFVTPAGLPLFQLIFDKIILKGVNIYEQ